MCGQHCSRMRALSQRRHAYACWTRDDVNVRMRVCCNIITMVRVHTHTHNKKTDARTHTTFTTELQCYGPAQTGDAFRERASSRACE